MIAALSDVSTYDAILVVGFGGPEGREDVMPFLENVLRGRNVPRERMLEVAEHYDRFGGVSPLNGQVRALIAALRPELRHRGIPMPIYWGNRNWHPMLADTMKQMVGDGVRQALAVVLAAYSSYSSCRQYREDIQRAREVVGEAAPGWTRCASSTIIPASSPPTPTASARPSSKSPPTAGTPPTWPSRRTASRARWPRVAAMSSSSPRPAGWWPRPSASGPTAGNSSIRAGAAGRPTPGSSLISSITCAP